MNEAAAKEGPVALRPLRRSLADSSFPILSWRGSSPGVWAPGVSRLTVPRSQAQGLQQRPRSHKDHRHPHNATLVLNPSRNKQTLPKSRLDLSNLKLPLSPCGRARMLPTDRAPMHGPKHLPPASTCVNQRPRGYFQNRLPNPAPEFPNAISEGSPQKQTPLNTIPGPEAPNTPIRGPPKLGFRGAPFSKCCPGAWGHGAPAHPLRRAEASPSCWR